MEAARLAIEATSIVRLALTAVILCAAVAGWWLWAPTSASGPPAVLVGERSHPGTEDGADGDDTVPATMTVHVSGHVASPGLVEIEPGDRVADAIAGAGGALRSADLNVLNLAAPVGDGDQVRVPGMSETSNDDRGAGGGAAGTAGGGLVRVNEADAAGLEALPGIGPVLAERIVAHRQEVGRFQTAEDLLDVPGIGEAKLEAIRDLVAIP